MRSKELLPAANHLVYPLSRSQISQLAEGDEIKYFPLNKLTQLSDSFRTDPQTNKQVNDLYTADLLITGVVTDEKGLVTEVDAYLSLPELPNPEFWLGADKRVTLQTKQLEGNWVERGQKVIYRILMGRRR